jgi:hypothetical protein
MGIKRTSSPICPPVSLPLATTYNDEIDHIPGQERVESKNAGLDDKKFEDSGHMMTIGLNWHF